MRKLNIQYIWLIAALLACQLSLMGQVSSQTRQGLRKTTFTTEQGEISVYLPGILKKGEQISGTVMAEPTGRNDRQWEKNKTALNGYVIEIQEAPENAAAVKNDFFKWTIPTVLTGDILHYVLKDEKGNTVALEEITVAETSDFSISSEKLTLPPAVMEGTLVHARSPIFDGDLMNTRIKTGNRPAFILAESSREAFFVCPEDLIGPQTVMVVEGNEVQRQETNIVDIEMNAEKTTLMRGESSKVTIVVKGLNGITVPIPVNVVNERSDIVDLSGGDEQIITILPGKVDEEGIYTHTLTVHARNSGPYVIYADISMDPVQTGPTPEMEKCPVIPEEMLVPPPTPEGYEYIGVEVVINQVYQERLSTVPLERAQKADDLVFVNSKTEVLDNRVVCDFIVTHLFEKKNPN